MAQLTGYQRCWRIIPRKGGKVEHKRRKVSQGQYSLGTTPPLSTPPSPPPQPPSTKQNAYQQREKKWLATDMNVQTIIPEQGTRQLRSRTIATRDISEFILH